MSSIEELSAVIAKHALEDGVFETSLPRVALIRSSVLTSPLHTVYQPSLCIVAQGRKQAVLGKTSYIYDAAHFLVVGVDLPVIGSVVEASVERPYLCLRLDFDLMVLTDLILNHKKPSLISDRTPTPALALHEATSELIGAAVRLLRLLDAPADAEVLAPLVEREILYRLVAADEKCIVRQIAASESRLSQINRAIGWMKQNYASAFEIHQLAGIAGMSASSFFEHFKVATSMSPLQYRNQLRLQEARRLMVTEAQDAATAGFRVGYESPSQFSRDYSRLFGVPPASDAAAIRRQPDQSFGA